MNEKVRALQREYQEKHLEVSALTSKADVTDADNTKAAAIMDRMSAIETEIEAEVNRGKNADANRKRLEGMSGGFRDDDGDPESDVRNFVHSGRTKGSAVKVLGLTKAGAATIDSFGSVVDDFKGGGTISAEAWDKTHDPVYAKAFIKWIRAKGNERALGDPAYYKALQEGLDDQGGIFVPPEMLTRIIMREPTPTRVASEVTTLTTGRDRVTMPRTQYSADDLYSTAFRATWTGEIPSSDTVADVTDTDLFGTNSIDIFTAMMSASLTNDVVEDSFFPLQGWLEQQLRTTAELLKDNMIINGVGVFQPKGLLANPNGTGEPEAVLSGTADSISADSIVQLAYRIPEQYADNIKFMFNRTNTERTIAALKDSQNNYLFSSGWENRGIANARPTNCVGYPIVRSGFMPNIGNGAYPIVCGDLRGYYLVNRLGLTIQILRETKAKRNQFELVARIRFGGRTIEPWRIKILKSDDA